MVILETEDIEGNASPLKPKKQKIKKINGKDANTQGQVLVGGKDENIYDDNIFTNVILMDNDNAKKVTEFLSDEQYVLIRK